ncbi:MAG: hypothetical protein KF774_10120 [Planctomyces sp.]|nr:hypothetical protein [Planctomyces sp.]
MKQPDFTELFFETFWKCDAGVDFRVRGVPMMQHDIVFLSSLLHDATFSLASVQRRGKRVDISLTRDRWEQFRKNGGSLDSIASRLSLAEVYELEVSTRECRASSACGLMVEIIECRLGDGEDDERCFIDIHCRCSCGGRTALRFCMELYPTTIRLRDEKTEPR